MKVHAEPEKVKETKPHEYIVRFVFGGLITALAGWIAIKFGPVIGGLFLGFPAILPASITLVQKHASKEKEQDRAKKDAGDDSLGATIGSLGLIAFGCFMFLLGPSLNMWVALACALVVWLLVSVLCWLLCALIDRAGSGHRRPANATSRPLHGRGR